MPEEDPVLRGAGEEEVVVEGVPCDLVHGGHMGSEGAEKLGGELHRAQLDVTLLKIKLGSHVKKVILWWFWIILFCSLCHLGSNQEQAFVIWLESKTLATIGHGSLQFLKNIIIKISSK